MQKKFKLRPIKPTLEKMKVGQRTHFAFERWGSVRRTALTIKREQNGAVQYSTHKRGLTIVVTRLV